MSSNLFSFNVIKPIDKAILINYIVFNTINRLSQTCICSWLPGCNANWSPQDPKHKRWAWLRGGKRFADFRRVRKWHRASVVISDAKPERGIARAYHEGFGQCSGRFNMDITPQDFEIMGPVNDDCGEYRQRHMRGLPVRGPKFKVGDMVTSYMNKDPRPVSIVKWQDNRGFGHYSFWRVCVAGFSADEFEFRLAKPPIVPKLSWGRTWYELEEQGFDHKEAGRFNHEGNQI